MFFELSQLLHFFFALDAMQTNYCDENQQLQLGVRPLSQTVSCWFDTKMFRYKSFHFNSK